MLMDESKNDIKKNQTLTVLKPNSSIRFGFLEIKWILKTILDNNFQY